MGMLTYQAMQHLHIYYDATSASVGQPQPTRGDQKCQQSVSSMRGDNSQKSGVLIRIRNGGLHSGSGTQILGFIPKQQLVGQVLFMLLFR